MKSVEYKVFANNTGPFGNFGNNLKIWIYFVFGFATVGVVVVIGGGGVGCIIGTLNPGDGRPTGNPGTTFGKVFSKSYGLFMVLDSLFTSFLSFFLILLYFFLVLSLD